MTVTGRMRALIVQRVHSGFLRHGIAVQRARNDIATTINLIGVSAVIDGGANVGQFAAGLRKAGYGGKIISCEPSTAAFCELDEASRGDEAWTPLRVALGDQPGYIDFNVSGDLVSSSILSRTDELMETFPKSGTSHAEQVRITTVDRIVADHALNPRNTALKLDVQGFESVVLDGATDSLGLFPLVTLEMCFVELYRSQALWPDLYQRMISAGFSLWNVTPGWVDAATGRTCWCDGVFVRPEATGGRINRR